jgi:phosphate transport system ATP-binding protein
VIDAKAKIEVSEFSFYYGGFQALTDINLRIGERKVTALIGPSGCGKSTFLRSINRMNDTIPGTRSEGRISIDGVDICDPSIDVVDLRQRVGMVFQRPNLFPQSVFDNVAYGPRVLGTAATASALRDKVQTSLLEVGLWDDLSDKLEVQAQTLNPGQQQQLCIARAIATKPDIILMDEPCSALDPLATLRVEELMRQLADDYTILVVTHNMQQAARVSDWTGFFWLGELVEYGPTNQIFTKPGKQLTEDYVTGRQG